MKSIQNKKIAFLHPDLGIGGAEQLILNMALALQPTNYVKIYTPHHDQNHCFPETKSQIPVEVRGNIIPSSIFGYGTAICAYLRMLTATIWIILFGGHYDIYIIDQVTVCLPLFWLFRKNTIFYCHFPDKLLCVQRKSFLKRLYRLFLDFYEEIGMLFANVVLVNSHFTKEIVTQAFLLYSKLAAQPSVLYPAVDFDKFDTIPDLKRQDSRLSTGRYFLSINRFERKKNIALSIHAFAAFRLALQGNEEIDDIRLVIAGGFDTRMNENIEHCQELEQIAQRQGVGEYVQFKKNITDGEKTWLLSNTIAVLYTPEREHFGIVPIEAMYNRAPIIACNSGGPKESIVDGQTGFLCDSNAQHWCQKMIEIYQNKNIAEMGEKGRQRVIDLFSFQQFQAQLLECVNCVCQNKKKKQ